MNFFTKNLNLKKKKMGGGGGGGGGGGVDGWTKEHTGSVIYCIRCRKKVFIYLFLSFISLTHENKKQNKKLHTLLKKKKKKYRYSKSLKWAGYAHLVFFPHIFILHLIARI